MDDRITFNIQVTMKERWINDFCSFLKYMEDCGNVGHSALVGFYADGDGDFRPKFEIDVPWDVVEGIAENQSESNPTPEVIFDAG